MSKRKRFAPLLLLPLLGCTPEIQSASGAKMARVGSLPLDGQGQTVEQANIVAKVRADADPGRRWWLYVVSPCTGRIILESQVVGKVTSSGKRLTPKHITTGNGGMAFDLADGTQLYTDEMPAEDGAFGESSEYLYWKDERGRSRRHYMTGGQIVHVSDQKLEAGELAAAR